MLEDIKARFKPFFVESCYLFLGEVDDSVIKDKSLKGVFKKIISDDVFRIEVYKNVDSTNSLILGKDFTTYRSNLHSLLLLPIIFCDGSGPLHLDDVSFLILLFSLSVCCSQTLC